MSRVKLVCISKEIVKEALEKRGINQSKMADDLGISKEHLNRSLSKGKISGTLLLEISKYLNLAPDYLDGSIDSEYLSGFKNSMQNDGLSESAIDTYLEYMKTYKGYVGRRCRLDKEDILKQLFFLVGSNDDVYNRCKKNYDFEKLQIGYVVGDNSGIIKGSPLDDAYKEQFEDQLILRLFEPIHEFIDEILGDDR